MSEIIENEKKKNSNEVKASEPHFDDEGYEEEMYKIKKRKTDQKEHDSAQVGKLTELLLKDNKMPINDFIDNLRKDGLNEEEIAQKLIIQGYSWDEFMNSSIDKSIKLLVENDRKEVVKNQQNYIFRFKDKEDLAEKYFDVLRHCFTKNISFLEAVKYIPLQRTITMEDIKHIKENLPNPDNNVHIDLSGEVLPDLDWSKSKEALYYIAFDDKTFSKTSKEHLPKGFDPKEIFEKGKSIGLGIDDVHKMGYTGKGVGVAICDWQLKPHKDIQTEEYIVEKNAGNFNDYFHASAVSSILVGKQTGVAPDSNLYFFAKHSNNNEKDGGDDLKSAFTKILEKNQELPDNEKIRVISISGPLFGEGVEELVKKLEDSGVRVLHSAEFWKSFGYLEKKDPMGDSNDFQNYKQYLGTRKALFVNSGNRTVTDPKDDSAYRHDTQPSASWAIPVVAGYYALACQADSTMTPEKFKKLARDTARTIKTKINGDYGGHILQKLGFKAKIKVIDIKALIQKIEEEKNK